MKKILLSLAFVAAAVGVSYAGTSATVTAADLDKVGTTDSNNNINPLESASTDAFTFTFDKAGGTSAPAYNTTKAEVRLYANNTMTVATNDGTNLQSMTFTIPAQGQKRLTEMTVNTGAVVSNGADTWTVVWTGDAPSVTFTVGEKATLGTDGAEKPGQFVWSEVVIVTSGEATVTPNPVITPNGGTFSESVEVTISCPGQPNAQIFYTTNGEDPTTQDMLYGGAFTLTESCQVKAYAVAADLEPSSVVAVYFDKVENISVKTLDDFINYGLDYPEEAVITYTGEAVVTYQNGSNLYIQDETAGILVYGNLGKTYENGVRLTGFSGKFKNYYETYEILPEVDTFTDGVKGDAFPATVTDIEEITYEIQNTYIRLNDVTIETNDLVFIDAKDASVPYYNKFGITLPEDGEAHDIIGIVSYYQQKGASEATIQIYPVEVVGEEPVVPPTPEDNVIADLLKDNADNWSFVVLTEGDDHAVFAWDDKYGMKATGRWDNVNHEAEGIVYYMLDLSNYKNVTFSFDHALNFLDVTKYPDRSWFVDVFAAIAGEEEVATRAEGDDDDTQINFAQSIEWPKGTDWSYINSGVQSLTKFDGQPEVQLGLYYFSGPSEENYGVDGAEVVCCTWEVKNLVVTGEKDGSGVREVILDTNAPSEYFNMQGVRVANPENGIFIRRQGNKVTKVVVK